MIAKLRPLAYIFILFFCYDLCYEQVIGVIPLNEYNVYLLLFSLTFWLRQEPKVSGCRVCVWHIIQKSIENEF